MNPIEDTPSSEEETTPEHTGFEGLEALDLPTDPKKVFALINEYELNLAHYTEDRPHLAPRQEKHAMSKLKAWTFSFAHNSWVSVPFSLSIEACRIFEAAFFKHGLQSMYVKAIMVLLKKAMVMDKEDDDEATVNEHFLYNTAVMINSQAVTRVIAGGYVLAMRDREFSEGMSEIVKL